MAETKINIPGPDCITCEYMKVRYDFLIDKHIYSCTKPLTTDCCKEIPTEIEPKDNVNHPSHYKTKSGLETIDVIRAFTEDLVGIEAVDTANIIKYICRWKKKNGLEDLKKAQWYLNNLIEKVEKENK